MKSLYLKALIILSVWYGCDLERNAGKELDGSADERPALQLPDRLSSRRIDFVLTMRDSVADRYWQRFNDKRTEGTFIYFNGEESEVFFPDSTVLGKLEDVESFSKDYVVSARTDTIPFHFELMISFDSTDHKQPSLRTGPP